METAQGPSQSTEIKEPEPVVVRQEPERELLSWTAPARPFKRRSREFYVTTIAIAFVVGLVLFIAEGIMPVILLGSLVFLYYIMNTVQPEAIEYKITTRGITVANKKIGWGLMGRFWFTRRFDVDLLTIETAGFPGRMEMVVIPEKKEEIRKNLSSYLLEEEAPPGTLEKVTGWVAKKLPGNN